MNAKIKAFWEKYEYKIILAVGFVLVAAISFEAGILKGAQLRQKPIIIEKVAENGSCSAGGNSALPGVSGAQNSPPGVSLSSTGVNTPSQDCAYVGSKNSNKYHLPTCQYAKRIKPENITCFKDENEAKSRGYLPDAGCVK
jgi:hypothetical protein